MTPHEQQYPRPPKRDDNSRIALFVLGLVALAFVGALVLMDG